MQPSPRALAFVQGFERLRLVGYLPTPDDKPTIGWGHTGPEVRVGLIWTRAQADAAWDSDVAKFVSWLNKALYGVPTTQGQFDALFSLVYNIGVGNLGGSSLLRYHKLGRYDLAEAEFPKWDHQNHKVVPGLLRRREAEAKLYQS